MSCPYQYYEDENSYYPMLYCKVQGKPCLYRKRCDLKQKYISIDGADKCYILMEEKRKDIPVGSCYVKAKQVLPNGYYRLYVALGNTTVEYLTNFKEVNQNYVYVKNNKVSLVPFKEENSEESVIGEEKPKTRKKKKTEE